MQISETREIRLEAQLSQIAREPGVEHVACALHDYETRSAWGYQADRWFHAASTIKVAVLVGLFAEVEAGRLALGARLHVRNRFLSALDGEPYRIFASRDANQKVHAAIGKTMKLSELAVHMIATSSNLATNLLLDLVGVDPARATLERLGLEGIDLRRGVEDERAFDAQINNQVTARGLLRLFCRLHEERLISAAASRQMLEILHQQEFVSGIPAGLPGHVRGSARIAHKTGEISTVAHDAGLVFLPDRQPYAVAILIESDGETPRRPDVVSRVSRAVYEHVSGHPAAPDEDGEGATNGAPPSAV